MKLRKFNLFFDFGIMVTYGQESTVLNTTYRSEKEKVNNLVHTKLDVKFDFDNRYLLGEAWITLEPHFYNVQNLTLDAKAMLIHKVSRDGKDLKYEYDGNKLKIDLGNLYAKGDEYTVYIKYTARPEEVEQEGSAAISDAKGLYFIDHDGSDPDKPTQIWTQGETESSSCWFPTIDSPNQKSTQEISITVPNKYVTLSNGLMEKQTENKDGTRTDYWTMNQKHAPYLFFMGVGEFSIVKDKWKEIDVDYYVEEEYESYAMDIFGLTPEMIQFYSDYTGVEYVWPKYAQIVGRDYVSGAMENTTAVLHGERAYQQPGDLIDENTWESVIAHELFHHWFGNLVTTESWSNLTVNESFANYSEYLWFEYKYGEDYADAHWFDEVQEYFNSGSESKELVRFYYETREDMFDAVSYNKGGAVLHMLRNYVGNDAFKAGLELYLKENMFGTGEAHKLRIAFEEISGKDLNWFFNQWYYGNGHPKLDISYIYSEEAKMLTVKVSQLQEISFEFPLVVEVYEDGAPKVYNVWVSKKEEAFSFKYTKKPKWVNVGASKTLLAETTDHKSKENYIYQYNHGKKYLDRREAIEGLSDNQSDEIAFETLTEALNDPFYGLRILAIDKIDISQTNAINAIKVIEKLAVNDEKTLVRAAAISKLKTLDNPKYVSIYKQALLSKSNAVKGSALSALYEIDKEAAMTFVNSITDKEEIEGMKSALIPIYIKDRTEAQMPFVADNLITGMFFTEDKETQNIYKEGFQWVAPSDNEKATQNLVDSFVQVGKQYAQYGADKMARQVLQQILTLKEESNYANKDVLVEIVKEAQKEMQ
jgi:aminopeptidase N